MPGFEKKIENSLTRLEIYLTETGLQGYDPYDAMNSKFLNWLSFNKRIFRLIFTQMLKRLPVNLRPMLGIIKDYNPKGLGLFLTAYLKLDKLNKTEKYYDKIFSIIRHLEKLKCPGSSGWCWGYNFDWQGEINFFKTGTPTIVNTVFIAHAFLDAFEIYGDDHFFNIALGAGNFILSDLYLLKCQDEVCFSYTPVGKTKIHNANVLGAGLLARLYSINKETKFMEFARKAVNYTINRQREDGSWPYGEYKKEEGVWYRGAHNIDGANDEKRPGSGGYSDNYHTGFVLESLFTYSQYTGDHSCLAHIRKGLDFFTDHFFLKNGIPRYYHNRVYPIDIHSATQAIVTLVKLNQLKDNNPLLRKLACWMIDVMQDKRGYFYYQKGRFFKNKIPYIRWGQAWALHALTTYYEYLVSKEDQNGD